MDKQNVKKYGVAGVAILVLALVAAIGVVYAAYTQSLNINGTANVKANSWKIGFDNLQKVTLTGEAQEVVKPTISADTTVIGNYSLLISKPGDSVTYTFDIVNSGTFNAKAAEPVVGQLVCTGTGASATTDAANVCKHLTYEWNIPESAKVNGEVILNAGATISGVTLTLSYADTDDTDPNKVLVSDLPKNDVAISGLDTAIVFTQTK